MNIKSTIVLLILAGGCVALFWKGPELAPRLGLAQKSVTVTDQGTVEALGKLPVHKVTRVEVRSGGQTLLVMQAKGPGQPLELLGNWPIRRSEADELVRTLRDLKSRFHPIPIDDKTDLKPYGLDESQKPIVVEIKYVDDGGKEVAQTVRFGEAPAKEGDNPFTLPAYASLEGKNELIRLGPHVLPILRRTEEVYRRRQIFPEATRERVMEGKRPARIPGMEDPPPGAPITFILSNDVRQIDVDSPSGRYSLERVADMPKPSLPPKRDPKSKSDRPGNPADAANDEPAIQLGKLADSWVVVSPNPSDPQKPLRDRVEPEKLRTILTVVPGIWVEKFAEFPDYVYGLGPNASDFTKMLTVLNGSMPSGASDSAVRLAAAFAALPEVKSPAPATITLTLNDGTKRTLQLSPTTRAAAGDEYRIAKIENNRFVFEIKSDKLSDLQIGFSKPATDTANTPLDELRDPSLARFDTDQVVAVDVAAPGAKAGVGPKLRKEGSDWKMIEPIPDAADRFEVEALLNLLKGMEARKSDIVEGSVRVPIAESFGVGPIDPLVALGLQPNQVKRITLTFDAESGRKPVTYLVGKHGADNKRAVMVEGWNRINLVSEGGDAQTASILDRQPSQFRSLKLIDPLAASISEISVQRPAANDHPADSFTLQADPMKFDQWAIVAPFKAESDRDAASALAGGLSNLASMKYVYDSKTDGPIVSADRWPRLNAGIGPFAKEFDLASDAFYGFDKPITITVKFSKPADAKDVVLEIGRARSNGDHFARVKGTTGIFTVPETVATSANRKPEDLVDKTLIQFASAKPEIQSLQRSMGGQDLEIGQNNLAQWEVIKPVQAKAEFAVVDDLINQLSRLKGSRIHEMNARDLKKYGLEPAYATVTLSALERSKIVDKVLRIGNPVNDKEPDGERFVKAEGSPNVAVIPGPLAKRLTASASQFRDRTLGEGFVSADQIIIERGERKITFAKGAGGWKVTQPLATDAEDQDLRELHDMMAAKPKAEEIVEDKPKDLARYGLDKPEHVRFFNGDKEVLHLLIGSLEKVGMEKKTAGLRAYAMLDKGSSVYLLDWRLTHMLTSEYRKRDLWPPIQPDKITEIAVKAADPKDSFTFVKGPMGWSDPSKSGDTINPISVADLNFALSDLRADRFVVDKGVSDLKAYGLDKPRTITITADGKKTTLLLGNMVDGKKSYGKVDDPNRTEVFVLNESDSRTLNRPKADFVTRKEEPKKEPDTKKKEPDPKKEEPKKEPGKK